MDRLPTVIATSVVRSTQQGESHGGVYLVDLELQEFEQVIDWNDPAISWEGRGGDRGLRGIALYKDKVYIAASDEIFIYDRQFKLLESCRNEYLRHCHEIAVNGQTLYLTSTHINGILEFDLITHQFTRGYVISRKPAGILGRISGAFLSPVKFGVTYFDPSSAGALSATSNDLHINNVSPHRGAVMIAGTRLEALLELDGANLRPYSPLPIGTHNAGVYRDGILYNDTRSDRIVLANKDGEIQRSFPVPFFADLQNANISQDHARPGFARGLCTFGDQIIIGGSSPSTISVYDKGSGERIRSINMTKDVRNCIHGLEVWAK